MNAETFVEDVASVVPGGYLLYDNSKASAAAPPRARRHQRDRHADGRARAARVYRRSQAAQAVQEHRLSRRARRRCSTSTSTSSPAMVANQYKGKDALIQPNIHALEMGRNYAEANTSVRCRCGVERIDAVGDRIMVDGNMRSARRDLWRGDGLCLVSDHAVHFRCGSLRAPLPTQAARDPTAGQATCMPSSRPRTSSPRSASSSVPAGTARVPLPRPSGPGVSLMQEFLGSAYFAEIPAVLWDIQRGGPSTGMPTRTQQGL